MSNSEIVRRPEIDIAKGIAMIMVILVHFNQSFNHNIALFSFFQMGCQIFFVASGFGAANSFQKRICNKNLRAATKSFYVKRFLSIAPSWYFILIILYIINSFTLLVFDRMIGFGTNRNPLAILCNVLFLHGLIPFCNNNVMPGGWYIGTTMLLYLITPILFHCLSILGTNFQRLFSLISSILSISILISFSILLPEKALGFVANNSFGYFSILTQYPCYILGMLLFFETQNKSYNPRMCSRNHLTLKLLLGICLGFASFLLFFFHEVPYNYIFDASFVGLSTFFILDYSFNVFPPSPQKSCKLKNVLIQFGRNSLDIYLMHFFIVWPFTKIIKYLISFLGFNSDNYILFLLMMPIVIFLSYVCGFILHCTVDWLYRYVCTSK